MTNPLPVIVAPNFHLPGGPGERLRVPAEIGWRSLTDVEQAKIVGPDQARGDRSRSIQLFTLPKHLSSPFWELLEQPDRVGVFDAAAAAVGKFLTFKQLSPPECARFELVLHGEGGFIEPRGLWGVVNLGDEKVVVDLATLRLILGAGEGCQLPEQIRAEIIPPLDKLPAMLLLVRTPQDRP